MTIHRRVLLAFAAAMAVLLTISLVGWWSQASLTSTVEVLTHARIPTARAIAVMREAKTDVARAYAAGSNLALPLSSRTEVAREAGEALLRFDGAWKAFEAVPHTDAGNKAWQDGVPALRRWREAAEVVITRQKERDALIQASTGPDDHRAVEANTRAMAAVLEARDANKTAEPVLRNLDDLIETVVARDGAAADTAASRGRTMTILALLLGAAALVATAAVLLRSLSRAIGTLVASAGQLSDAVEAGTLDVRADLAAVSSEFRPILEGSNRTMESMSRRFRIISEYMDRISRGDLPPPITTEARGEFQQTRDALNRCVAAVGAIIEDTKRLGEAATAGDLRRRADEARHQGGFHDIVAGFNATLDRVLEPIDEAGRVLEALSQRDLGARVETVYRGDHARIADALNATAAALEEAMAQVAQAVEQVSGASGQIAASSESVAAGASEQASSLEETSASLESMASMAKHAADSALQANGLAQGAQAAASEGSAAVEQMTGAMERIKAAAEGTSQIIKDINEIAFQTNLLALNAAVEAARAGEAGRGFAVVAEEVRSLALRSKEAANKTEDLIRQSVREAGEGEVTARHVRAKLAEIAGSVTKVGGIIAEITATAKEQTAGIDQVSKAVQQMNQVTQQNAANSEESSSAAAELSGQSEELAAMIATFRLKRTTARTDGARPQVRLPGPAPISLRPRGTSAPARGAEA